MKHEINKNGDLVIRVNEDEQYIIAQDIQEEDFHSDNKMREILESLICNSELEFCQPEEIGALTSAPCLCIRNDDMGTNQDTIEQAWAFMSYQMRSVQQDLAEQGCAIFQKG